MISDQRTHNRVSFFLGGDIFRRMEGDKLGRAIIHDISYSGARIETLEPLKTGEIIYLDFQIAGKYIFNKIPAMVSRISEQAGSFLSGLSFNRGEDRRRIRQALAFTIENSI